MRQWKPVLAAFMILAVVGALALWFAPAHTSPASSPAAAMKPALPSPAHEQASLEAELKKKPGHAPVLLRLAQLATEQGRPQEARKRLEELLKGEPANSEALLELGRACYELNDLACATASTEKILIADANHVDALYNLGAIYANTGDSLKARTYWQRAVKIAPTSESGLKSASAIARIGEEPTGNSTGSSPR